MKSILQCTKTQKQYTLFTDPGHYAYSEVLTQACDGPDDLRPKACTSSSFSDMQERWSAKEKEAFAVYQSDLKFDLYLRGVECILCCDHKPLDPFLSKGMKIPKLDQWAMELADYNITFVHINGSNTLLADVISQSNTLDIYRHPIEDPTMLKASDLQQHITEVNTNKIHT